MNRELGCNLHRPRAICGLESLADMLVQPHAVRFGDLGVDYLPVELMDKGVAPRDAAVRPFHTAGDTQEPLCTDELLTAHLGIRCLAMERRRDDQRSEIASRDAGCLE